ncbi:hypothetical protein IMZ48_06170 [Candidatus Bathyarchaeota archaeon]|nr:hypothetical protein [Candidatus Bathyarchaeota archaeon]
MKDCRARNLELRNTWALDGHHALNTGLGSGPDLTRYVVFFAEGLVISNLKRQPYVAVSTTKAELIEPTPAGLALLSMRKLMTQIQRRPLFSVVPLMLCAATIRHFDIRIRWTIVEKVRNPHPFSIWFSRKYHYAPERAQ